MPTLFEPVAVGSLTLRNRLMRSATAERLSDPATGAPRPALREVYRRLAQGGVALIVTGHAYVAREGRAHPEMSSMAGDRLIDVWRETIAPAQALGARVMVQLNHAGASCDPAVNPDPLSPSGVATAAPGPRAMTEEQILRAVAQFGRAARRARAAGFDGVQIHGAHGYLASQFLGHGTNRRDDRWGGDPERRVAFLLALVTEVRRQVGDDYPVWVKLGVAGAEAFGPTLAEGARAAAALRDAGVDAIEVSNAMGVPEDLNGALEAPFLPLALAVRAAVGDDYPLALVNRVRTRATMEAILESGAVQMISLCRPLIAEPDLPDKLARGEADAAACVSCGHCWPQTPGEGVRCHNAALARGPAGRNPDRGATEKGTRS